MATSRRVIILGSTGSIGTQALDIIRRNRDHFDVVGLSANGGNPELLASQAREFNVPVVAMADASVAARFTTAGGESELLLGEDAATKLAGMSADVVLNGITGSVGLLPTLAVLKAGTTLALANKESLGRGWSAREVACEARSDRAG